MLDNTRGVVILNNAKAVTLLAMKMTRNKNMYLLLLPNEEMLIQKADKRKKVLFRILHIM